MLPWFLVTKTAWAGDAVGSSLSTVLPQDTQAFKLASVFRQEKKLDPSASRSRVSEDLVPLSQSLCWPPRPHESKQISVLGRRQSM